MNISGKIIEISDIVQIKETFQKREFVVEYANNPKYPEFIKFEAVQDKCALLDEFQVGQEVSVEFDLRGRKWTDREGKVKYFNSLQAWRLAPAGKEAAGGGELPQEMDKTDYGAESSGDMPF